MSVSRTQISILERLPPVFSANSLTGVQVSVIVFCILFLFREWSEIIREGGLQIKF